MLMSGLGLLIFGMIRAHSSELYPATLFMRVYFIACIVAFYAMTGDPLFLDPRVHHLRKSQSAFS
jgi:small basic protein